jgi:glycosyltransferase involved in cell wall biosynthesis
VFPCSRDGTKYLISKYGNPKGKIKTVYLGTRDYGTGSWIKQTLPCLVSCSRITEVKRIDRIIDALELLERQNIAILWMHIGGGEGLEALKRECQKRLNLSKIVFTGNVPNTDVKDIYLTNNIDIFLNVSENEGLPISIMEAVSFGIPVIATDVGGTSEIVNDNINGIMLKKDFTNEELVNAIRHFLFMANNDYLKMRANARRIWEERFKFQNNSLYMLEITGEHFESS